MVLLHLARDACLEAVAIDDHPVTGTDVRLVAEVTDPVDAERLHAVGLDELVQRTRPLDEIAFDVGRVRCARIRKSVL